MVEKIFIGVAWPYANGSLHLGQIAGADLPPDIFARYHRIKQNEVLMVSGSDKHGTPTAIKAEQEGKAPEEIAEFYQQEFLDCWQKLGISFDLYTSTGTDNHAEVAQDIFLKLLENDYLYKDTVSQAFCSSCQRYLPDRYIEGTCPNCHSPGARGDQCEACGKLLDGPELIEAHCRICGTAPVYRDSEQFFFRLPVFRDNLLEWVRKQTHWRQNVLNFTTRFLEDVWFEAVIGYLSATKEWAKLQGEPEKWREFWQGEAKSYYFLGKDNIVFHSIIWPAMLMGYGGLNLPYDVPANEFLTFEGRKLSTSQNWAVWLPDYLSRYDPDPLRYLLSVNMPETNDTDFSWREFVRRNNDELVATYGNLVHRVLTFVYRNFNGCVPTRDEMGTNINMETELPSVDLMDQWDSFLSQCRFKQAIKVAMTLAHETNRYLDEMSPWKVIKEDRQAAARSLYVALCAISQLRIMLYPFLPFSSQKLHELLGFDGNIEDYIKENGLQHTLPTGQELLVPEPLFVKLDEELIEEETGRMGQSGE